MAETLASPNPVAPGAAAVDVGGPAQPLVIARDLVKHFPLKSSVPFPTFVIVCAKVTVVDGSVTTLPCGMRLTPAS